MEKTLRKEGGGGEGIRSGTWMDGHCAPSWGSVVYLDVMGT